MTNGGDVAMPKAGPVLVQVMAVSPPLLPSAIVSALLPVPAPPHMAHLLTGTTCHQ